MIKYDSNELKMMIQDIIIADFTQDFKKMYATKSDLFDILDGLCETIDDQQREISFLSGQLESANNDLRNTQIRLENLKKYGAEVPDIRDMYPGFDYHDDDPIMADATKYAKQHLSEVYGKGITTGDRLDPDIPDDGGKFSEQDLPFPDVEDIAPAEEVEGSDE